MLAVAQDLDGSVHAQPRTSAINVLYVDDEQHVRNAFRRTLSRAQIPVTVFECPQVALEHLKEDPRRYSVIAADYQMGPGMDGASFLHEVQSIEPSLTRILISGQFDVPRLVDAVNNGGIYQVVSKPWDASELMPLLRRASERCLLERDNTALCGKLEKQNTTLHAINAELDALVMARTKALLDGLVSALDLRDTETQWHSRRVAAYARRLGAELGVTAHALLEVEYGALLHDIGKIGISDGILLKPGKLNQDEWHIMRTHPSLGYSLLKDIDFLRGASSIVHQHHERFDGSGYPNALSGERIVIGARIFSVVDALDVITTTRPYKRARSWAWAREEIVRCAGSHFDPAVVQAYMRIPDEEWQSIQQRHTSADDELETID